MQTLPFWEWNILENSAICFSIHTNLEWYVIVLGQIIFFLLSFRTDSSLKEPDSVPQNTIFMLSGGKFELASLLHFPEYILRVPNLYIS